MFTYELARRLEGSGVTATVLHPGVVNTAFGAEDQAAFFTILSPLMRPFMKAPTRGAATSIYLASSPQVEGLTGQYFASSKPKKSSKLSYDSAAARRLWQVSAELVCLAYPPETPHMMEVHDIDALNVQPRAGARAVGRQ